MSETETMTYAPTDFTVGEIIRVIQVPGWHTNEDKGLSMVVTIEDTDYAIVTKVDEFHVYVHSADRPSSINSSDMLYVKAAKVTVRSAENSAFGTWEAPQRGERVIIAEVTYATERAQVAGVGRVGKVTDRFGTDFLVSPEGELAGCDDHVYVKGYIPMPVKAEETGIPSILAPVPMTSEEARTKFDLVTRTELAKVVSDHEAEKRDIFSKLVDAAVSADLCGEFDQFMADNGWSGYNTREREVTITVSASRDFTVTLTGDDSEITNQMVADLWNEAGVTSYDIDDINRDDN